MNNEELLTEKELSRSLKISLPKLRKDRIRGKGFPFVKIGKSVRYPVAAVHDHLKKIEKLSNQDSKNKKLRVDLLYIANRISEICKSDDKNLRKEITEFKEELYYNIGVNIGIQE